MLSKDEVIKRFDPSGPGTEGNIFGLPFSPEHAEVILIPTPWEVTVSYHSGTARGPKAILQASRQVDHFIKDIPDAWKLGVNMLPVSTNMLGESDKLRSWAKEHIARVERGEPVAADDAMLAKINEASENFNIYVKSTAQQYIREGKMVGLVGGDHSTPLGLLRALSEHHNRFGILQFDAHADLRRAYEGFTYSHASIMYNALKIPAVGRIVQVGIRDWCAEEMDVIGRAMGRVVTFFDEDLKARHYKGDTWDRICDDIIHHLPPLVYISFDIDGLDPKLCPNSGTPVPGGLEFQQVIYLLKKLVLARKKIIGFDLTEVAPGEDDDWDANVGARLLYQLCHWMGVSHGKLALK
ncbi:agmatinase family protein [Chryseolinea lacunae]|uniref:Agmatinase family protein n=1 Tax=Chryseolinea lacunae TaxID=2801331 RepID=A0ABS1KX69_9BACT|nr:agmatinase family protein [Chryseolinea lacunae]MBL0744055.1 agmatinase family protein [Chryseolinea lacunae]